MMDFTVPASLGNGDDAFETEVRFSDKGKGRYVDWKASFQLTGLRLEPDGVYEINLKNGGTYDILVLSCEALPPDRYMITASVQGDIDPRDRTTQSDAPPPPLPPKGMTKPPWLS